MMQRIALAAAIAALGTTAVAQTSDPAASGGYVTSSNRQHATGAFGQCVRTGYWTPAMAAEPCDATARASSAPVPVAQQEPAPVAQPAPAPLVVAPPRPVIEKVTLS